MRTECIIGIKFEGDLDFCYRDSRGLRKPYFFHLPHSPEIKENYSCFKMLGGIYELCNAIAAGDEDPILLKCIVTDEKEEHENWIEMEEVNDGYNVHNLPGYMGENGEKPFLELEYIYSIPNPKYIYLKKI